MSGANSRFLKTNTKVAEADGVSIDIPARSDIYSHAVLVTLNSQMADSYKARLAQTCLLVGACQVIVLLIYFI